MNKKRTWTKAVAALLLLSVLFSFSGCGSTNSVRAYSSKTTIEEIEKRVGEAKAKRDIENSYSWLGYDSGTIFCGINCSELEFYFTIDEKQLTEIYLEAVYEQTNADSVDNLIKDLTKEFGTPSIKKNTSAYNGMSYTEYRWDNSTYVILRADGEVLSTIIIAVDNLRKAYESMASGDYYAALCAYAELDNTDGVKTVLKNLKYGEDPSRVAIMTQNRVAILRWDSTINEYWIHYYDFDLNSVHGVLCDYDLFEKAAPNDVMSGTSADVEILYLFDFK